MPHKYFIFVQMKLRDTICLARLKDMTAYFPHGILDIFVSKGIDHWIQEGSENSIEYWQHFVYWEISERPHIDENAWAKEKGHNSEVGTASGEGFGGTTRRTLPHRDQDDGVGDDQENETHQGNHATGWDHEHPHNVGVYTGKFNHQGKVTKETVHFIRSTEGQIHSKC